MRSAAIGSHLIAPKRDQPYVGKNFRHSTPSSSWRDQPGRPNLTTTLGHATTSLNQSGHVAKEIRERLGEQTGSPECPEASDAQRRAPWWVERGPANGVGEPEPSGGTLRCPMMTVKNEPWISLKCSA
jgi:hypothetical protein